MYLLCCNSLTIPFLILLMSNGIEIWRQGQIKIKRIYVFVGSQNIAATNGRHFVGFFPLQ